MKLRDKQCDIFVFMFTPKTQQLGWIPLDQVLHYYQIKKMESRPDMIAQFTNWIADYIQGIEGERPEIYVHVHAPPRFSSLSLSRLSTAHQLASCLSLSLSL